MSPMDLGEDIKDFNLDYEQQELFIKLREQNDEILDTIDFRILDSQYTSQFTFEELERIVCDKAIQETLINLDSNSYKVLMQLKENILINSNWIEGFNILLKGLSEPILQQIANEIVEKGIDERTLRLYFELIVQGENYFDIKTLQSLENFAEIRNNICDNILEFPDNEENMTPELRKMSLVDRTKFALIEKNYGISLFQAKLLCQKYGFDVDKAQETVMNQEINEQLKTLSAIVSAETIEEIKEIEISDSKPSNFLILDSKIRENFAELYNNTLYSPTQEDFIETINVDGNEVPVYAVGKNFFMCTHVVGAFSEGKLEQQTYQEAWNASKRKSHVFCTRMLSNEKVEVANERGICYGFNDFDSGTLIASAPWDMASISFNTKFDTVGEMDDKKFMSGREGSGSRFLFPNEQINNTRGDGNETNWDRFDNDGNRKQPSYIVYIVNDMNDESYKHTIQYQQSLEAASSFNIPIVLIEREKIIENEHKEIDNMIETYRETGEIGLIKRIIERFENNRTTGRFQSSEKKYKEEFPLIGQNEYASLEGIIAKIANISDGKENSTERLQQIIDVLMLQAVRDPNFEEDFANMVYSIVDLNPNLHIDMNKILKEHLGITASGAKNVEISENCMKTFYQKQRLMQEGEQFSKMKLLQEMGKLPKEFEMVLSVGSGRYGFITDMVPLKENNSNIGGITEKDLINEISSYYVTYFENIADTIKEKTTRYKRLTRMPKNENLENDVERADLYTMFKFLMEGKGFFESIGIEVGEVDSICALATSALEETHAISREEEMETVAHNSALEIIANELEETGITDANELKDYYNKNIRGNYEISADELESVINDALHISYDRDGEEVVVGNAKANILHSIKREGVSVREVFDIYGELDKALQVEQQRSQESFELDGW